MAHREGWSMGVDPAGQPIASPNMLSPAHSDITMLGQLMTANLFNIYSLSLYLFDISPLFSTGSKDGLTTATTTTLSLVQKYIVFFSET